VFLTKEFKFNMAFIQRALLPADQTLLTEDLKKIVA